LTSKFLALFSFLNFSVDICHPNKKKVLAGWALADSPRLGFCFLFFYFVVAMGSECLSWQEACLGVSRLL
jgi:hypothetical protein